ncbi:MAG: hypothetical protein ACYC5K_03235 [Saccharofermentanales bacterium]
MIYIIIFYSPHIAPLSAITSRVLIIGALSGYGGSSYGHYIINSGRMQNLQIIENSSEIPPIEIFLQYNEAKQSELYKDIGCLARPGRTGAFQYGYERFFTKRVAGTFFADSCAGSGGGIPCF